MPDQQDQSRNTGQFKKGVSGNPKGRPKGASLTDKLQTMAREKGMELVETLWYCAVKERDMKAMAMIWDRVEGKVIERIVATSVDSIAQAIMDARDAIEEESDDLGSPGMPGDTQA